jgi:hypothetical protein
MPLVEVVGKAGIGLPEQMEAIGVKVGVEGATTVRHSWV